MFWPFTKKGPEQAFREFERDSKVAESQRLLLEAATSTADAANLVTTRLRDRLEDSMRQLESTARILNDALIVCDASGQIQSFNPAAERMFDLGSNDPRLGFIGNLFQCDHHALSTGEDVWALLTLIEQAEAEYDLKGVRHDGTVFVADVNHTRLDRSDGQGIVLLILREAGPAPNDISYRMIFEASFDGILIVQDGDIVAANPALGRLFGYEVKDLLRQPIEVLVSDKDRDMVDIEQTEEIVNLNVQGVHQDGHAMNLLFTTTPISWEGNGGASLITVKDISSIMPVKSLQPDMICCFNSKFIITFANAAFANFYGVKRNDILGKDIRQVIPTAERGPFLLHINSLTKAEPTRKMQLRSTTKDGISTVQDWVDHACFEDDVEYQRIGRASDPSIGDGT